MNVLIYCNHIGLGNFIMFLQAIKMLRLEGRFNWLHNSRHFDGEIDFVKQHNGENIDCVFLLYPNFFIARKIKLGCPMLGFFYNIKGIEQKSYLTKALKWNWNDSEIENNKRLLKLWLKSYSPLDQTPGTY